MYLVGERLDADIPHTKLEGQTHTPHERINIAIMFFSGPPIGPMAMLLCCGSPVQTHPTLPQNYSKYSNAKNIVSVLRQTITYDSIGRQHSSLEIFSICFVCSIVC